jgi:hypothetical protein
MLASLRNLLVKILKQIQDWMAVQHVVVLGDSHASIFHHRLFRMKMVLTRFDTCYVGGATASGLTNPNSETNAQQIFNEKLSGIEERSVVLLILGEVDTGFVIWYRAQKHGRDVSEMFEQALENYQQLINRVAARHRTIVVSTPLPTISDSAPLGEVANLRKEIGATQIERTRLTLEFNRAIHSYCEANNIAFIDLDSASLGKKGLVDPRLLNADPTDHHYDPDAYAGLLIPPLKSALSAL